MRGGEFSSKFSCPFWVTTMTCQGFLQCTLKLLNFLVALVGAFMILYSLWMLKEWHSDIAPPSSSDSPSPSPTTSLLDGNLARDGDFNILTSFSLQVTDAGMEQLGRPFLSYQKSTVAFPDLPDPWFIYAFMAGGIFTLLVTCTGHVAAETSNSFCLSCYTVIQIVLLLVQFAIAGVLFFDSHWHEDLPDDPTGELDKIKEFLEENLDICKWVALSVVVLEVLGLFFATVLRVVSASTQRDYDSDEEYLAARASRQAVGNHQLNQATTPTAPGAPGDTRLPRKDAWSTRMRDKFGVDTAEFSGAQQNAATPAAGVEQQSSWCTIM